MSKMQKKDQNTNVTLMEGEKRLEQTEPTFKKVT